MAIHRTSLLRQKCESFITLVPEAFSATRSTSLLGGLHSVVTFDRLLVNVGGDFNPNTGLFQCRIAGAYYFTLTVGKYPKKLLSVMLVKNRQEVQAMVYNEHRKQGRKVQSQSTMISLSPMDTVWLLVQQNPNYALYSNFAPYITFSGYLVYHEYTSCLRYLNNHLGTECLPHGHPRYSWRDAPEELRSAFSVARTSSLLGEISKQDKKEALTFDVEYVNIGGHFNKSSGKFVCRFPGVYYFSFTVGKYPRRAVSVKLMKGAGEVQAMVFDEDTAQNRGMQSQSLLLFLNQGDIIWLYSQQDKHYAVYSNQGRYTTFTGFLLYPK
ncbi:Complement C1q tumor necrosis factor-related protein 4 [Bagarius yarrelli]|uniref:Complement C1q tumor necrosis factor-related protein 4 n=1 Tax=Bagarius yarrelli TaxID=175774 RepID=A0A556TQW4_BAGYA|nr:Complement C1q tumor necrosis factor-related protein 4 [Bagarius yarrelli]